MAAVCTVGDTGSHGGTIASGSPNIYSNGFAVARNGDTFDCDIHGPNPLIGSSNTKLNGESIIIAGDSASCGATMSARFSNVTST